MLTNLSSLRCREPTRGPIHEARSQRCPQHRAVGRQWDEGRLHRADLPFNGPPIPAPLHDGLSSHIALCAGAGSRRQQSVSRGAGSPGTRLRHLKPPSARAGRGSSVLRRGLAGNQASYPTCLEETQVERDTANLPSHGSEKGVAC